MNNETTLSDAYVESLESTLRSNPLTKWADILSKEFNVDYQIVEMIITGYEELGPETMRKVFERVNKGKDTNPDQYSFYNSYLDNQRLEPTQEQRDEIDAVIERAENHVRELREEYFKNQELATPISD